MVEESTESLALTFETLTNIGRKILCTLNTHHVKVSTDDSMIDMLPTAEEL
jgi:hypothetical protein